MPVNNRIAEFHEAMTEWRRDIHAHPELGYEEQRTSKLIVEKLTEWGIEVHDGIAKTGVVGVLHGRDGTGGDPDKSIALRADMDALPIEEATGLPHASTNPGKMHACGHDGHVTMLLGAAKYLAETRNFDGTVYFVFQPAEEGGAGGDLMVKEGLFDRFPAKSVWGMHNWPEVPIGEVAVMPGPMMAAADRFKVTVKGYGAHAAMPHYGIDPVLIGSHIVTMWQSLVSRRTDPLDKAVISTTTFHAGSAFNVIPEEAELGGTVRTFTPEVRDMIEKEMQTIAESVATSMGGSVEFSYVRGYPPTINSAEEAGFAADVASKLLGSDKVHTNLNPCMGAEDFSFMLEQRPGAYIWLGQADDDHKHMVHHPLYDFNDRILPLGASYWAQLVEASLPKAA
ncbi:MAG: amidohydrolase [Alphaproteobacteria bacterium]|nr:amidohydrolase [Alphaproteobacteria bacterium SS10]